MNIFKHQTEFPSFVQINTQISNLAIAGDLPAQLYSLRLLQKFALVFAYVKAAKGLESPRQFIDDGSGTLIR